MFLWCVNAPFYLQAPQLVYEAAEHVHIPKHAAIFRSVPTATCRKDRGRLILILQAEQCPICTRSPRADGEHREMWCWQLHARSRAAQRPALPCCLLHPRLAVCSKVYSNVVEPSSTNVEHLIHALTAFPL